MSNFLRKVFKRLTTSKSRPSYFLCPPQLTSLETRINPTPITVNTLQDTSATDAFISLREAIDLANINSGADTIVFASSLFTNGPATISLTGVLPAIADATSAGTLTITGPGANTLNISGNNGNFSVFSVASLGDLTISGVTVSGANNSGFGGAFNNAGVLTISASTISGNSATSGGGILTKVPRSLFLILRSQEIPPRALAVASITLMEAPSPFLIPPFQTIVQPTVVVASLILIPT